MQRGFLQSEILQEVGMLCTCVGTHTALLKGYVVKNVLHLATKRGFLFNSESVLYYDMADMYFLVSQATPTYPPPLCVSAGALALQGGEFGSGVGTIVARGLTCTGEEPNLLQCPSQLTFYSIFCTHLSDVGVLCPCEWTLSPSLMIFPPTVCVINPFLTTHSPCN